MRLKLNRKSLDILMVDDEAPMLRLSSKLLVSEGHRVCCAQTGEEALKKLEEACDVVIADLKMPGMDGIKLLKEVKSRYPNTEVIILTGYGTVDSAVEAMKKGAYTYASKPFDADEILAHLDKIAEIQALRREIQELRRGLSKRFGKLVGQDEKMLKIYEMVEDVAKTPATVLIQGESGTGKELIAHAVQYHSSRRDKPFVKVSCAALPEGVLESELFGHKKGAFSGAIRSRAGRFQQAHTGTLFLDEISEISPNIQVKLLRVLQEYKFEPVGEDETKKVDIRLICATNKDLYEEMKKGAFREDLFYRINVITIHVPPLRERTTDISLLAVYFLDKSKREMNKEVHFITDEALEALKAYDWPGNVRELGNAIERAVVLTKTDSIDVCDLPENLQGGHGTERYPELFREAKEHFEKAFLEQALRANRGNVTHTSELIGLGRRNIQEKIRKYGIDVARIRKEFTEG